ncbi:hemicentin-1 [Plakobranchus ocellatus]|uniref:Hemicentin-1 n=1 Tax=Plakobranchus ocellatus TaxID=259542 RepID=A0AAV3XX07_9GAST|nr:hemicentin-1 [Plakobranchus ocellatus]
MKGNHYERDEDVKIDVRFWRWQQTTNVFADSTRQIVQQWQLCIDKVEKYIKKLGMTSTYCATFCGSECGMFHYNPLHNECSVFLERDYDVGVTLVSDPDWIVGFRKRHTTVTQGEWTLVFRAQSSIGVSVWDTWTNTGLHDDNPVPKDFPLPCLRLTEYESCDRHFRSHILDNWSNVKEVRFSLVKSDTEVAYVLFNGTGTDRDSWFSQNRIVASTWAPGIQKDTLTLTGMEGFHSEGVARRFYLFGPHAGCPADWFYTMTLDVTTDLCTDAKLWRITYTGFPTFFYSTTTGRAAAGIDIGTSTLL